ncbi:galactocerebrosidase-like isoform X2 [Liolophura sinensis]
MNYPEQQLNEILDYLFKPNYGASLHILKVEIGGDSQSTDGTESSHMHESWDENYRRGYEWWLMVEAKKRNPDILLYGLPWAFPGWIGNGTNSPYNTPSITADYIARWIAGAKNYYGLQLDYIGIWNERNYDITYIKTLRKTLDQRGMNHVQIVAADGGWGIADDVLKDPQLAASMDYIGTHYPGTFSTPSAVKTDKQLWASEDYSTFNDNTGGGCWARILNQNYVNGYMTATISWNLIASYYANLPFYRDGLMTAVEPWSGNYIIEAPIWVSAHTTQFTQPGWRYLPHGNGVGKLASGGSYVSLTNISQQSLTIVIETMSHNHSICIRPPLAKYDVSPQNATFKLSGSFAYVTSLNVWYTKIGFDGNPSTFFKEMPQIDVVNGAVTLSLGVDEMYTLTTVSTGQKGTAPDPPPSEPFPLPYKDNFDNYEVNSEPYNLAQQVGVWEVVQGDADRGGIIRQVVVQEPVHWCAAETGNRTLNIIGSPNWTDIYVQCDVRTVTVSAARGVFVAARVSQGGCQAADTRGIFLYIYPSQQRYVLTNDLGGKTVLKSGLAQTSSDWNTLGLLIQSNGITGMLNNETLFTTSVPQGPKSGFVGVGTDPYGIAEFDNLEIMSNRDGWARISDSVKRNNPETLYFRPQFKP